MVISSVMLGKLTAYDAVISFFNFLHIISDMWIAPVMENHAEKVVNKIPVIGFFVKNFKFD
jgi:hypothetical protein